MKCGRVCETCMALNKGQLHLHDFLPALDTSAGYDEASRAFTSLPVPFQLTVRPSGIPGAGLGVFANTFISSNVRIGLFEGKTVSGEQMKDCDTAYAWEINEDQQSGPYLIDGKDQAHANWLRYVNCARYSEEQNLIAYQYKGNIYYRTIRHIYRNDELLVWYGNEYAKELGLNTNSPDLALMNCQYCGDFMGKDDQEFQDDVFLNEGEYKLVHGSNSRKSNGNDSFGISVHPSGKFSERTDVVKKKTTETRYPYTCGVCGKRWKLKSILSRHMVIHSETKPFQCKICKQFFSRKYHLQIHEVRIHSTYKCLYCSCSFNDKRIFHQHIAHHSRSNTRASERKRVERKGHQKHSVKNGLLRGSSVAGCEQCVWCKKTFDSVKKLKAHITLGHKPFQCSICKVRLMTRTGLQRHHETHTGKSHRCDFCGNCYTREDTLKQHVKLTHSESLHYVKCKDCGKAFSSKRSLQYHLKDCSSRSGCHVVSSKDALQKATKKCKFCCRRTFVSNKELYDHMTSHLFDNNGDQQKVVLKLKSMLESKDYKCNHCGACFNRHYDLCLHQRFHAGHAVFKCEYCKSTFENFKLLKEHMIRHPEKIRCEFCERSFSRRHHLLRHLQLIHCRMALCVHCRKLYANRSQLNKHVRRMHSVSRQEKTVTLRDFTINISPLRISSSFNTQ